MKILLAALTALLLLTASAATEPPHVYYLPIIVKTTPPPKHGLAASPWYDGCTDAATVGADWWYNWWAAPGSDCPGYVPMIWGAVAMPQLGAAVASSDGWLLGFNEPDFGPYAISPARGAELWRQVEAAAGDVRLVSPAPSQHNPAWLKQMAAEYQKRYGTPPRFDAIGVHIYASDPAKMRRYIEARHLEWPDKLLWVTEFNGCYERDNWQIMADIVPWLEAQPYIARYAWFVSRPDANPDSVSGCTLLTEAGQLTPAGELYSQ